MDDVPYDERIRQVCALIQKSIENVRLFRKTVLLRKCLPSSATGASLSLRRQQAACSKGHKSQRHSSRRRRYVTCCPSASPRPTRTGAGRGRVAVARGKALELPPLPDLSSRVVWPLFGESGRTSSPSPSRSQPPSSSSLVCSASGVSMSRREPYSLHSSPGSRTERRADSKDVPMRADDKKRHWNPVPQATLIRARQRAEAAEERRVLQMYSEVQRCERSRPHLHEMLSWDSKNHRFLPPQATLLRALARTKREDGQQEGADPSSVESLSRRAQTTSNLQTSPSNIIVVRRRRARRRQPRDARAGDSSAPHCAPPNDYLHIKSLSPAHSAVVGTRFSSDLGSGVGSGKRHSATLLLELARQEREGGQQQHNRPSSPAPWSSREGHNAWHSQSAAASCTVVRQHGAGSEAPRDACAGDSSAPHPPLSNDLSRTKSRSPPASPVAGTRFVSDLSIDISDVKLHSLSPPTTDPVRKSATHQRPAFSAHVSSQQRRHLPAGAGRFSAQSTPRQRAPWIY